MTKRCLKEVLKTTKRYP